LSRAEPGAVVVERAASATDEVRGLLAELDAELAAAYLPEQRHGLTLDAIFEPHVRFFIARLGDSAVGCGGVALFETYAEVKRMYVREPARGRGVARAVLARLETETLGAGLSRLALETGLHQRAAVRLYESAGFRPRGAFGAYESMAPSATATSLFFEKDLRGTARAS
jgi:putative acetyltransferase